MPVVLKNNAVSRLAASLDAGATTLSVTAGEGEKFPSLVVYGEWFPLTIVKANGALEVCKAIGRSGDVINIARAQEGTAAQAFAPGDRVELRLTTDAIADIVQMINTLRSDASLDANNLADLTDKAVARANLQLGSAAIANTQVNQQDATPGRLMLNGAFGIGGNVPLLPDSINIDDMVNVPFGLSYVRATNSGTKPSANGIIHTFGYRADAINQEWWELTGTKGVTLRKFRRHGYTDTWGPWVQDYDTGSVAAYAQTLLAAASAADARAVLGAMDAAASLKQNVELLWSGNVGTVGIALPLARPLVAGDLIWIEHTDVYQYPSSPLVWTTSRAVAGLVSWWPFGETGATGLTFDSASQLTTAKFLSGYPIGKIYASKAKV